MKEIPISFEEAELLVTPVTKRIKGDVLEAYGNAVLKGAIEVCHDAICGCPQCRRHAKKTMEYFDLIEMPSKDMARTILMTAEKEYSIRYAKREVTKSRRSNPRKDRR